MPTLYVSSVLNQACVGRCYVSDVHNHPLVFGSIISIQFSVKHTIPALRTPINQHDVGNFILAHLVKDTGHTECFIYAITVFWSSESNQVYFPDRDGRA